jgi:predicted alpha/beta superfamily hydrolase
MTGPAETSPEFEELGHAVIAWADTFRLRSAAIGQDFLIEVALPPGGVTAGTKLPVVFVLDGNSTFGIAAAGARGIQSGPFPMPPTLVVGIG